MLKDSDCYCPIIGDASSVEDYFHTNKDKIEFYQYLPTFDVQRLHPVDEKLKNDFITNNETLTKINNVLKFDYCMIIEMAERSWVNWHIDSPRKGPVLNLLLTPNVKSHSLFVPELYNSRNIVECVYPPHQFVLYNTDIIHSVLTFNGPRYIFHITFEKAKIDLSWEEAKRTLDSIGVLG